MVALLAEYDALPKLGHGCGHNIVAAIAVGAGAAAAKAADALGGSILVVGTPAEELHSGKTLMVKKGAFSDIDAALIVHPGRRDAAIEQTLACISLEVEFFGREAHAAAFPEGGVNALEAMILSFNAANSLRQHIRRESKVHGIIMDGGKAMAMTVIDLLAYPDLVKEAWTEFSGCANRSGVAAGVTDRERIGSCN